MCDCAMVCNAGIGWQGAAITAGDAAREAMRTSELARAPHVLMRPSLSVDGNMWCALYGENLQDGLAGFGETPELAMADFDKNWREYRLHGQALRPAERETIRQRVEAMRPQIEAAAKGTGRI